jgi:hypothetical protein
MIELDTPIIGPIDCSWQEIKTVVDDAPGIPAYDDATVEAICRAYIDVASFFGLRPSIFAGQSMHETGYLRFGGLVSPEQNNFHGLGATNDGKQGNWFIVPDLGMIAAAVHHWAYIAGRPENWPPHLRRFASYDPRLGNVLTSGHAGKVHAVGDYTNGRWAWSPDKPPGSLENGYARGIRGKANQIIAAEPGLFYPLPEGPARCLSCGSPLVTVQ